ncbi:Collar domain-containing protein [Tenacibaculum sp. 190524A02b]|uniref:Collar domain-containing protein n=1 Tax=Tenacibaculum vairaonense TaxID=3137860 RepID=A0ABM9PH47_9FLAO
MKSKKNLVFTILALVTILTSQAQISFSNAGIAVQGIARNPDNSARVSETLSLKFEIYAKDGGNEASIVSETKNLTTDAFGVFSHVLEAGYANNPAISNGTAYLRISEGTTVISDEKLNHVPYAISANNGVPTGSIMPYIGTTAPTGWVLCNGQSLTSIEGSEKLRALVGNNAPNLLGMFLRGTGTNPTYNQSGPNLKATQDDTYASHIHDEGSLKTSKNGEHDHDTSSDGGFNRVLKFDSENTAKDWGDSGAGEDEGRYEPNLNWSKAIDDDGDHTHTISGNTGSSGSSETRPINYGVNYIIKL